MTIGWYVHHHGAGHGARCGAVAALLDDVTVFSSTPRTGDGWVHLPVDDDARPADPTASGRLHWAPLRHGGLSGRMATIARWIAQEAPAAFVVDVSVEVALLTRLLGVPTVVVAQRGHRFDSAHALAYDIAESVVAPWTVASHLPGEGLPDDRVDFVGAISRFDEVAWPAGTAMRDVLLLVGAGGHALHAADVVAAASATPQWRWHTAGALRVSDPRVTDHGSRADVQDLLGRCGVVVGTAGANVVAEVAAARRPLICLPQARPFDEQHHQAEALSRLDLADVHAVWPRSDRWADVLEAARARDPARWSLWHDGNGARRFADIVTTVAHQWPMPA